MTMAKPKSRVKMYPGVDSGQIVPIVRQWLSKHKLSNAELAFADILDLNFNMAARLAPMVKFADLFVDLVSVIRNAKVGHACFKKALNDLLMVEPTLLRSQKKKNFVIGMSCGIRVVMTWFREYAKGGDTKRKLTKVASSTQRALLEQVAGKIIIDPADDEPEKEDGEDEAGIEQKSLEVDHI